MHPVPLLSGIWPDFQLSSRRAGLYKQLATLKGLLEEYREKPEANQSLRGPIIQNLSQTGLDQDCPFRPAASSSSESELLSPESAEAVSEQEFTDYVSRVYQYLQVRFQDLYSLSAPV